ncbi:MAG TPA: GNAT family N-acetyltransferase [Anaerolineales bacterium]|nr:GNAT family N-acetyltransferase [Anaerolineae bacterium]HIQ01730.1 GNAT family N-acetyltransferase [Anaerolineales bacterium]
MADDAWEAVTTALTDPERLLAHFTLAADLTTLRGECRFARSERALVARYDGLPFAALAFWGEDPGELAGLATRLVDPGEVFYLLLNEQQMRPAERAFAVEQVRPEWQMLFMGDPAELDPGDATELGPEHLEGMRDLAAEAGLMALEVDPFRHGPAFGVWAEGTARESPLLVAMGATHLAVPGGAEIGNVATRTTHRRRGLARQVVAALVRAHAAQGRRVFLMVFQTNRAAVLLYESLGFVRLRPMFLMRCRLRAKGRFLETWERLRT